MLSVLLWVHYSLYVFIIMKVFDEYLKEFGDHHCYPFMLKGAKNIHQVKPVTPHSLIFGNESSGLDDIYMTYGQSVFIPHTNAIDSLNLATVCRYWFIPLLTGCI